MKILIDVPDSVAATAAALINIWAVGEFNEQKVREVVSSFGDKPFEVDLSCLDDRILSKALLELLTVAIAQKIMKDEKLNGSGQA